MTMSIDEANQALRLFGAHMSSHPMHEPNNNEIYHFIVFVNDKVHTVGFSAVEDCDVEPFYKRAVEDYL